jgi:hypothetical protein
MRRRTASSISRCEHHGTCRISEIADCRFQIADRRRRRAALSLVNLQSAICNLQSGCAGCSVPKGRQCHRGRESQLNTWLPLPPNRTGGFPASGSPVGGLTSKRTVKPVRRLRIGEQPTTGPNGVTPPDTPRPGAHSRRAAPQSGSTQVPQDRACPARLALSGTHGRWWHRPVGSHVSTFLHPFARRALPRFLATMGVLTPGRLSSPPRSPCFTWLAFRPFRLQPPSGCRLSFCTRPLSSTARLPRASGRLWLRSWLAGSPPFQAESSSSSYGPVVHLLQLSTSPRGDAVAFGFRPERVCLEGTYTPLTTTLAGALAGGFSRRTRTPE